MRRFVPWIVAAVALWSQSSLAQDKQACVNAYEQAQYLRKDRKLIEAKKSLLVCAQNECPAAVRNDCTAWLAEIEGAMPSVVFGAFDPSGKEIADAKVSMDGVLVAAKLDGSAVAVDPGQHTFKFERAGSPDVEETFIVKEGEKHRIISVRFKDTSKPVGPVEPKPEPKGGGGSLVLPLVLAGVGVVGIGGAVVFGLGAKSDADDLRATCAPRCTHSAVDDVKSKLLLSDIFLGVGVVSLGLAAYFFVSSGSKNEKAAVRAPIDVRPQPGGGVASYSATF